jgi:hypothetical protein
MHEDPKQTAGDRQAGNAGRDAAAVAFPLHAQRALRSNGVFVFVRPRVLRDFVVDVRLVRSRSIADALSALVATFK